MMSQPALRLTPLRAALKAGAAQDLPCLVSLVADDTPVAETATRPALNLALVLDVSPSMDSVPLGASNATRPIEQAKEAARLLIARLAPTDRVALVIYATTATVLMPSSPISECRDQALRLLANVTTRETSTALHAGWLHGAQAIAPHVAPDVLSRILLLSDGAANTGECRSEALAGHTGTLLREAGISTSTYGVGNHFNEELMTMMGQSGGGQAFYATEASELADYFDTELNLMAHSVARQIEVTLTAPSEGSFAWLTGHPHGPSVRLSDLVAGTNSWALALVKLPATLAGQAVPLSAQARWVDSQGVAHTASTEVQLVLSEEAGEEDAQVAERFKEAEAARLQREARAQAARGDFAGAQMTVQAMASMAGSNAYVASVANNLNTLLEAGASHRHLFQKEAAYGAYSMSTRSVLNGEDVTSLKADRLGLRKSVQGRSAKAKENQQP
jgi:Ca-activated chloride channel homolog